LRQFVVLGLRKEVHRHPVGVGLTIADDQYLRRAGDHVDADDAEDAALGRGDVGVAGADDLVDLRNGLRAIGQCRDRLRAADGEYAVDAGQRCGSQYQRVLLARRRRYDHDQFADAGDARRNGVHQHRRRVRGLAAGHVEADAVERRDLLAKHGAARFASSSSYCQLCTVCR
jgi:hypothetical protein